ncbi:hypothetical protein RYZ26_15000 [Terasakiella sp. A23]|uniref:hypothetical protein n=1 Tax=Terasakiella sp. FCG-A23 TaxID=3080561 RepID=UPI0029553285|nr:hypothetical protein [Terasakiella sp. A23]MDV7340913.1 hypothetical protein [Terasakiella sp. A23]
MKQTEDAIAAELLENIGNEMEERIGSPNVHLKQSSMELETTANKLGDISNESPVLQHCHYHLVGNG